MGAKQSKRSMDISGKDAEGAGEVAAAGAGGEGRVEQLADADALKPQLNGDAHIHEISDKEKELELDSGTPENEKDATTEKESKVAEDEKDIEAPPATNGEAEKKTDNSDTATPEEGKKSKKEKVKKKWSLRSISFSRKDKPKQEKKQKDEEPKTNGEPEKVPEETAEVITSEVVVSDVPGDNIQNEAKEKTPETPVTEPITNGSSTPESPKAGTGDSIETGIDSEKLKLRAEPEPEQLPVNGLSLEDHKTETSDVESKIAQIVENKMEEQTMETTPETTPTPEIPVKEVCVDRLPLIEPTPPPLPANPPPSSVASFAATTMAPELAEASPPNTAENATPVPLPTPAIASYVVHVDPPLVLTKTEFKTDLTSTVSEPVENDVIKMQIDQPEAKDSVPSLEGTGVAESESTTLTNEINANTDCGVEIVNSDIVANPEQSKVAEHQSEFAKSNCHVVEVPQIDKPPQQVIVKVSIDPQENDSVAIVTEDSVKAPDGPTETGELEVNSNPLIFEKETTNILDNEMNVQQLEQKSDSTRDSIEKLHEVVECKGNIEENNDDGRTEDGATQAPLVDGNAAEDVGSVSEEVPPPPVLDSEEHAPSATPPPALEPPQEPIPTSDKMAILIPEMPAEPELKTETLQETSTDIAEAN